jgi:hypothetical protein
MVLAGSEMDRCTVDCCYIFLFLNSSFFKTKKYHYLHCHKLKIKIVKQKHKISDFLFRSISKIQAK